MSRIDEARSAWEAAVERMEDLALQLEGQAEGTDEGIVAAFEERFAEAEREAERCKQNLDRLERIATARSQTVTATTDPDAPADAAVVNRTVRATIVNEPVTYDRQNRNGNYYFRDVLFASMGDAQAQARLQRHMREAVVESRALSQTAGAGGEFVPPLWLMDEYATVVRMGRPFANAVRNMGDVPPNTPAISIPKLLTGTAVAAQTEGSNVQATDATSGSLTSTIRTIAGEQVVSRQFFDRALPGADQILFGDLISDYNTKLDIQLISGSGSAPNLKGVLQDSNRVQVTYTTGTPTVAGLYSKTADAIQQIVTNRGLPPDTIVFHPRRWSWIVASVDSQGRPLVVPTGPGVNQIGTTPDGQAGLNQLGRPGFTFQGLEVVVDANLPTLDGAGTNEDKILVCRTADDLLWEGPTPNTRVYEERQSQALQVVLQIWNYAAFTTERYSKANASIGGTGLVAPTF